MDGLGKESVAQGTFDPLDGDFRAIGNFSDGGVLLRRAILRGMNAVEVQARERVQIRMRESGTTLSAWRVSLCQPEGAIVLAEVAGKSWYRGEGALLGSSQEKLAELWVAARSTADSDPELPQYG